MSRSLYKALKNSVNKWKTQLTNRDSVLCVNNPSNIYLFTYCIHYIRLRSISYHLLEMASAKHKERFDHTETIWDKCEDDTAVLFKGDHNILLKEHYDILRLAYILLAVG